MSRTGLLCDWTTVQSSLASVEQGDESWADVSGFGDAAFWVEVSAVTPPGGASASGLELFFETSPSRDGSLFLPATGPLLLGSGAPFQGASATPLVVTSVTSASTVSLARYVRWRIAAIGGGTWSLTFRVRIAPLRQRMFSPRNLSGCALWLRSDLGITLDARAGNAVTGWADQSGNARDATQTATGSEPPYVQGAVNGLPALKGDGSSKFMTTPSFSIGASTSIFTVVQPLTTTQSGYARIVEQDNNTTYYLGVTLGGTAYKLIVADGTSPYGAAETGTVQLAPSIVSATYDVSSGVGTIYENGASAVPYAFGTTPSGSQPLYLLRYQAASAEFWNGYLAEVIVYSRALTPNELLRVHRYLGGRYGIAVT